MKNLKVLFLLTVALLFSCNSGDDPLPKDPNGKDPLSNFDTREVVINFPVGNSIDLQNAKLLSWDIVSPLESDSTGKIANIDNEPSFAYLFDKEDNFLLVGLIDSKNVRLDIKSTAKVLLYWGLNGPFYEVELAEKFFNEVESFPVWDGWIKKVEQAWQEDPFFLQKEFIGQELGKIIKEVSPNSRLTESSEDTKASDILVNGSIASGLQVSQVGLSQIEIANTFRRRVKGFLYKTIRTKSDGSIEKLNEFPGANTYSTPDMEIDIPTPTGITSFSGTVYDYMLGDTEKSFRIVTDPVSIPLDLDEKNATWQLRAVGMGSSAPSMNQVEIKESTKIAMLTFTLDFVVPLIGDALTAKAAAAKNTGAPKTEQDFWEALIIAVTGYVDKMPDVSAKIEKGELSEAVRDFFTIGYNQFGSIFLEDLARVAAESIWESLPANLAKPGLDDFKQSAIRKVKILTTIDLILKGSDYARKVHDIKNSKQVETFEILAKEIELNLEPRESEISIQTNKKLTAYIKSTIADGQVIEYEWSTSGKYGYLYDDIHKGNSFSSSKRDVNYFCSAEAGKFPSNATDTVTVTTYIKQGPNRTRIGTDKALIKIQDKIVFTVGWEKFVTVNERETQLSPTGKEYFLGARGFKANFNYSDEVAYFELRNVKSDGTKANAVIKTPDQLKKDNGYEYRVGVGSIIIINTYSESVKNEWVEKFNQELDSRQANYSHLEVTVIPK